MSRSSKTWGLSATSIFGLFIAIFIGVGLVSKEVGRRSIYTILSKPVRRHEVILGKYVGLVLTLAVNVAIMTAAVYAVLGYLSLTESEEFKRGWDAPATDPAMLVAFLLILVQLMLVTAIALFFSTFSSPLLAAVMTGALYVAGHFNADLRSVHEFVDSALVGSVATGVSYVLPDLASFNVTAEVVHAQSVGLAYVVMICGQAAAYIGVLLVGAMFVFSRRDFV